MGNQPGDARSDSRKGAIRRMHRGDVDAVAVLIEQTISACYGEVYPQRAVGFFKEYHSKERIAERLNRGITYVVECDREMMATGSLVEGEITGFFVHPEHQRKGYGRSLMEKLEEAAKEEGYVKIELSVSLPSKKFYEKMNYSIRDEHSKDAGGGQKLRYWSATKIIQEY